jgi:imidazolonepropionase-like amidohydrolase
MMRSATILLLTGLAAGQVPAPKQARPLLLKGGAVHTVSGPVLAGADILVVGGKIAAVGNDLSVPDNTEVVDLVGKHVYPGLIAATSALGLTEIGAVLATKDSSEIGDITPEVRSEVAVNPDSLHIPIARLNGVALALTVPEGGLISGTSAVIMLDGWTWEEMTVRAPVGVHVSWPSSRPRRRRGPPQVPGAAASKKRDSQLLKIKDAFAHARAYAKLKQGKDRPLAQKVDRRWESMRPVIAGKACVFVHADGLAEIEAAVDWGQDEGLRLVIVGGQDAWRCAPLLKERDVPVIVTATHRLPRRRHAGYDAPFTLPKKLLDAGVRFCIAGAANESANLRNLPYQAAHAAAYGLPRDEALKAITLYAANVLGIADRVGSIEKGKDATLIVTNGDPLEIRTQVERLFMQGRDVQLDSHQKRLWGKYREKYRRKANGR